MIRLETFVLLAAMTFVILKSGDVGAADTPAEKTPSPEDKENVQRLKRGTSETLSAAGALAEETKEQAQRRLEKELKKLDGSMDDLKGKLEQAGAEAKDRFRKQLPEFERRKEELSQRLQDLKTRSGLAWDDMATGTEAAIRELRKSFEKAKTRFE